MNTNWIFDSPNYYENEGFLGPDLVQCTLEPIVLDARTYSPGERYNWFNNSVQPTVSVNSPGIYWAKVTLRNNQDGMCSIFIGSHGKEVEFGSRFMDKDQRVSVAKQLKQQLKIV